MKGTDEAEAGTIRLDKWLWQARFFKTRGLASRAIAEGVVRLNRVRVQKPATTVAVGDGLSFVQHGRVRVVRVRALGARRGPATEARRLYDDLSGGRSDGGTAGAEESGASGAPEGLERDGMTDK